MTWFLACLHCVSCVFSDLYTLNLNYNFGTVSSWFHCCCFYHFSTISRFQFLVYADLFLFLLYYFSKRKFFIDLNMFRIGIQNFAYCEPIHGETVLSADEYIFICRHQCFAMFQLVSAEQNVETKAKKVHIPSQSAQTTVCSVLSIMQVALVKI